MIDRLTKSVAASDSRETKAMARAYLLILFQPLIEITAPPPPIRKGLLLTVIQQTECYIHNHFMNSELSLGSIARGVGFSPNYLTAVFRKAAGRGLWETVVGIRIAHARVMLMTGEYSVKEVAGATGWCDPLYFSKVYRKLHHEPPSATLRRKTRPP